MDADEECRDGWTGGSVFLFSAYCSQFIKIKKKLCISNI